MFTKHTNKDRDWSSKGNNTVISAESAYTDYRAVIASISVEVGVEKLFLQTKGIDITDFKTFLGMLRKKNGKMPLALYLDNLGVHTAGKSREEMERLDIRPIWNPIYSPEYNPIEMAFAKVKAAFKRKKLNQLVLGRTINQNELVY
jgi:transposase